MILVESILGNIRDDAWRERLEHANIEWLNLDQWEAQKTRIRKLSTAGTEVAISLSRGVYLRDGDVLFWDDAAKKVIAARISVREVMVVRLEGLGRLSPTEIARACVELGHALGNQHWPAVVKEDRVFVPLTVDQKVMASVMKTHAFEGIRYEFVSGGEVIPYLAPHEARRLFGGAEGPVHFHVDSYGADHSPTHSHSHNHPHPLPHEHEHTH